MTHRSRRRFLHDSLLVTAAAAGADVGRAAARAEEARPSTSPNERLSVAGIGVRGQGNGHLGAYSNTSRYNTEVTHICDADEAIGRNRVEEVAKRQGRAPQYVQDLRKVYDDPAIDVVSIATPNHWHALAAIWALQADKD